MNIIFATIMFICDLKKLKYTSSYSCKNWSKYTHVVIPATKILFHQVKNNQIVRTHCHNILKLAWISPSLVFVHSSCTYIWHFILANATDSERAINIIFRCVIQLGRCHGEVLATVPGQQICLQVFDSISKQCTRVLKNVALLKI